MTMSETTRQEVKGSALRYLQSYLATGLVGFLQAGLDRVRVLGIDPSRCSGSKDEISHLIQHVELYA
jgi:hypothetical protein